MFFDLPPSPLQKLALDLPYHVYIKRDDLLHETVSGNKWRKLKYNLQAAFATNKSILVTKGGNYSNHIYAMAAAGKLFGFETIGLIRGEALDNATLRFAREQGMTLVFCNRSDYRNITAENYHQYIPENLAKDTFFIPEGGTNQAALRGAAEIVSELKTQLPDLDWSKTIIACAVGTAGTISGIVKGADGSGQILGFAALKGNFLSAYVTQLADNQYNNWRISDDYHFGGYARWTPELIDFIRAFEQQHAVPLEPIYTAKVMYGLVEMMTQRLLPIGSTIIAIHTGGLQGRVGFTEQFGIIF